MCEPKWVIAFGVCASTAAFIRTTRRCPAPIRVVPVDVYIPGCPPRPEQVLDALILLQERIQRGEGHSQVALRVESDKSFDVPVASIKPRTEHLLAGKPPSTSGEG